MSHAEVSRQIREVAAVFETEAIVGLPEVMDQWAAALEALVAENQQLRDALEEACDWLDADLTHAPDVPTALADRELVSRWRSALDRTPSAAQTLEDTPTPHKEKEASSHGS